ncbi:MAG: substrate-binding domain-containing protein [Verrucomicrobia bacterium]|nr:substrate-binding domain-containing protein [Verrucomicrobiota bacterium]
MNAAKALNLLLAATVVILALLYVSAAKQPAHPPGTAPATTPHPGAEEEYVLIAVSVGNAYWIDARDGFNDAARDLGVRATFTGPQGSDVRQQVDLIDTSIGRGVRGIILVPAEPEAVIPAIDRAIAAGIPVITQDTDSPRSRRYTFIGTGNFQAGRQGGDLLARQIGGRGEVAILTIPGQWNLEERRRGYEAALAQYPGIKIVAVGNDQAEESQAAAEAKSILQAHPDLAGMGCVDAAGGVGAAVAVRDVGKQGVIKIIAMDRNEATLDFIEQGFIQASLAQRSYSMAYLGLQMLHDLNHGKIKMIADWRAAGTCPLPALVDTGAVIITPANVRHFRHAK